MMSTIRLHQVIEDPLDREVRQHRPSELAQDICQLLIGHGDPRCDLALDGEPNEPGPGGG